MTDADKLRALADWFDARDDRDPNPWTSREVQRDLRRIAKTLEGALLTSRLGNVTISQGETITARSDS